ncbi:MAG TPA: hypothetical protein VFG79_07855, partial [Solirubrobacter sp.]|nr:hypothetical protein [Solirubrobacter sp.]
TATLVRALTHPGLLSSTQGNVSVLPNGSTFVGWGSQRWFSEFDAAGKLILDGHIAPGHDTYRAYRKPWSGTPTRRPRAVAKRKGESMTVHASWNGATDVARWQLLAGATRDALEPVSTVDRAGFETAITAPRRPYAAMRALDAEGAELATSAVVRVR